MGYPFVQINAILTENDKSIIFVGSNYNYKAIDFKLFKCFNLYIYWKAWNITTVCPGVVSTSPPFYNKGVDVFCSKNAKDNLKCN